MTNTFLLILSTYSLTWLVLLIESVTYPDFLAVKTHLGSGFFISLSVLFFVFFIRKIDKTTLLFRLWNIFLKLSGSVLIVVSFAVNFLENYYFPNYVFSKFHIIPAGLSFLAAFTIFPLVVLFLVDVKKINKHRLLICLIILISIIVGYRGLEVIPKSVAQFVYVFTHLNLSYAEKIRLSYGRDYDYFQLIDRVVPADATIVIPPQLLPWRHTGDINFNRYFLYPRREISGYPDKLPEGKYEYVMISSELDGNPGDKYQIWPNFSIPAERIYVFDLQNHEVKEFEKDYRPADWSTGREWGLIKIKSQ